MGAGRVSHLQVESLAYAALQFRRRIGQEEDEDDGEDDKDADGGDDDENERHVRPRKGFFLGDGTGMGKGRQLAAMILDATRRGRARHVWVSVSSDLVLDAKRDLRDVGGAHLPVILQRKSRAGAPLADALESQQARFPNDHKTISSIMLQHLRSQLGTSITKFLSETP